MADTRCCNNPISQNISISSGTERWKWNWLYSLVEHYIARLDILDPQVVWEWTLLQRYKIWGSFELTVRTTIESLWSWGS